jgi:hypothetical protein
MPGTMLLGSQAPCSIWLVMVGGVAIQGQPADLDQCPARVLATIDRLEQVTP